jgi:hypothetical protein
VWFILIIRQRYENTPTGRTVDGRALALATFHLGLVVSVLVLSIVHGSIAAWANTK